MRLLAPKDFTNEYIRIEQQLYRWLAAYGSFPWMLVATAAAAGLIYWFDCILFNGFAFEKRVGAFDLMRMFRLCTLLPVVLSLFSLFLPVRFNNLFQFLTGATIWASLVTPYMNTLDLPTRILIYSQIPVLVGGGWCLLRYNLGAQRKWPGALVYSAAVWLTAGVVMELLLKRSVENRFHFFPPLFHVIWLTMVVRSFRRKFPPDYRDSALNPISAFRGMFWPQDSRWAGQNPDERRYLWWWGILNILLGYSLVLSRLAVEQTPFMVSQMGHYRVVERYIFARLGDVGVMNLLVGMARILGFRVSDATNFVFLSRTPAEIWRRGSVYNYLFILQYVYVPLMAVIRNRFIVTFVSFLLFFLNHFGYVNFFKYINYRFSLLPGFSGLNIIGLNQLAVYFLVWFVILFITSRFWFFSKQQRETAWGGWTSILCSHIVFIAGNAFAGLICNLFLGA